MAARASLCRSVAARTTKRFPSPRCASAIQIVRPLESIAETQPQLQPALLRLSAMISQYFTRMGILTTEILWRKENFACERIFYCGSRRKTGHFDVTAIWRERTGN